MAADERIRIDVVGDADRYAKELARTASALLTLEKVQLAANLAMEAGNRLFSVTVGLTQDIVKSLVGMAQASADLVDQLNTQAEATGLSVDSVMALKLAADRSGKSLDQLVPKDMAVKLAELRRGSVEVSRAFAMVGLSAADFAGLDADQSYQKIVRALYDTEDSSVRAAAAMKILGEAGKQTLSAFGDVSEFDAYLSRASEMVTTSDDAADATAKLQRVYGEMAEIVDEVGAVLLVAADNIGVFDGALVALKASGLPVIQSTYTATLLLSRGWQQIVELSRNPLNFEAVRQLQAAFEDARRDSELFFMGLRDGLDELGGGEQVEPVRVEAVARATKETRAEIDKLLPLLDRFAGALDRERIAQLDGLDAIDAKYDRLRRGFEEEAAAILAISTLSADQAAQLEDQFTDRLILAQRAYEADVAAFQAAEEAKLAAELERLDAAARAAEADRLARQAADAQAALAQKQTQLATIDAIYSASADLTTGLIQLGQRGEAANAAQARRRWQVEYGVNVAIATGQALLGISRAAASAPPPANLIPIGIASVQGAANVVAVAATPPPRFHIGTRAAMAPDERAAVVTQREVVLTPQGQEAADLNAGIGAGGGDVFVVVDHVAVGVAAATSAARAGTPLYNAIRRGDLPGHSRSRR